MKKDRITLVSILILVLIKNIIWVNIMPPMQAPDEPSHFAYVQYMGEYNKVPIVASAEGGSSAELLKFLETVQFPQIQFHPDVKFDKESAYKTLKTERVPEEMRESTGSTSAAGYPPAYYLLASLFYKMAYDEPLIERFNMVRYLSILLSLVSVFFAFLIGKEVNKHSNLFAASLAIFIGFNPMLSMISISVNNDILMNTLAIVILYWIIRNIKNETKLSLIVGGILLGIGMLTKAHMLYVVAFSVFILIIVYIYKRHSLKNIVSSFMYLLVPFSVVYSGWAVFSYVHYRSLLGSMGFQSVGEGRPHPVTFLKHHFEGAYFHTLWSKFFWANFGWLDTLFSSTWLYVALDVIVVVSVVGVLYGFVRKQERWQFALAALTFASGNLLFLYAVEFKYYMTYNNFMLQGRYLFTALAPIGIIILMGSQYLLKGNMRNYVLVALSTGMIIFNLCSIDLILNRYY